MKLYYSKGACSLAVRIVIHEIGLPCEFESVNLKTKQTETGADFLKINPKGAVPVLIISQNEILTENAAIQQYLADQNNATSLLPAVGQVKRYKVLEWLNFVSTELHKGCGPLFNPNISQEMKNDLFKPQLKNKLDYVEKHLKNNKWLMGDEFTLPDGYLFVIVTWLPKFSFDMNEFPNLSRYANEIKQRKSVRVSLQEEGMVF